MINQIKQDLRAMMNGVASAAMRNAGMTADYRVNFGVELPRLQDYANELREQHPDDLPTLAQSLWHESVRECRLLALMLYPAQQMDGDLADIWLADIHSVELAQMASLLLFSRMPKASESAFRWMAADDELQQIEGFYTIGHLLRTTTLNERAVEELRDQATAALASENIQLQLAAQRALARLES